MTVEELHSFLAGLIAEDKGKYRVTMDAMVRPVDEVCVYDDDEEIEMR